MTTYTRAGMMRVFLVQTAQGLTPSSGGYNANANLLRSLRKQGHETAQLCYATDTELQEYAERAKLHGVEPNVAISALAVVDPPGQAHELGVKTFTDEHNVYNVTISRTEFNEAYPVREF